VWRDWALVGAVVPAAVLEALLRPELAGRWVAAVAAVGVAPLLLWRRTRPLLVVTVAFGVCFGCSLLIGADLGLGTLAYLLLLPYSLYRWGSGREVLAGSAVLLAKLGSSGLLGYASPVQVGEGCAVLGGFAVLGLALRYRAGTRLRELDRAKLLERERLARDLHDTVAHHVSAMAIRAQAGLATAPADPAAATDALRVIEAEASRTLTELRSIVRVLRRDEPAELAPGPLVADLRELAGGDPAGPAVRVEIDGDVAGLPPAVQAAIYRLAQESVTNARRHARHASLIAVTVAADDTAVRLLVSDDGDTGGHRPARSGGYGLVGMRERAGLLGGTCQAGPGPDRGWTVTAVLPRAAT
jgi:signal transduction histidine kinase